MKTLSNPLLKFDTYIDIKTAMSQQAYPIVLNGCVDSQKAHFIPNLGEDFPCRFVLTYKEEKAKELYQDLSFFDPNTVLYPSRDVLFYSADVHSNHIERQRMDILKKIVEGKPLTIVACLDVFMEKMIPFEEFKEHCLTIDFESIIDTDALKLKLSELGYENSGLVEAPGQFGIRGGIIDIFPLTEELPVRIELWGDEVDSIRSFDTETQRSVEKLDEVQVYPATEMILSRNKIGEAVRRMKEEYKKQEEAFKKRKRLAEKERLRKMTVRTEEELLSFGTAEGSEALLSYFYEKTVSFLEYLPENTLFFIDEPHRVLEKGKTYEEEFFLCMQSRLEGGYVLPGQADLLFGYEEILSKVMVEPLILLSSVIQDYAFYKPKTTCDIEAKSIFSYNNSFDQLIKDLEHWKSKITGFCCFLLQQQGRSVLQKISRIMVCLRILQLILTARLHRGRLWWRVADLEMVLSTRRLNLSFCPKKTFSRKERPKSRRRKASTVARKSILFRRFQSVIMLSMKNMDSVFTVAWEKN